MFCSVVETFTSILFIHFVQGTLDLSTDGSKVIISENVTLTCKDILKSRSVLILYKSNSDPAFNTIVNCPFGAPLCSVNGGAKYGYQKDLSHADYNEFKVILKNFSDAFYGDYKCQDFDVATSYDELPIPYTANLEDKCSNIITCSDPNAECLKSTSVCACKPGCIEVNGKCKKDCEKHCWAVVVLFIFAVLQVIIIIIIRTCACCNDDQLLLMMILNYANYITVVWSVVMVCLINTDCKAPPDWCAPLAIVSLVLSGLMAVLKICLMLYTLCDSEPGDQLHELGMFLRSLHICGDIDQELTELPHAAWVLLIGIGIKICVICCKPDIERTTTPPKPTTTAPPPEPESDDHPHVQPVQHSDTGKDKTVGVPKRKDKHSEALISTTGNANQQPRDSGAVSRTDIELTEGNYGQEKPMLRAQPPLPGSSKSHQPVDEPHHKETRGLSSNFEDPNSLPQFEVRKTSLAPLNATAKGESDSTVKKKKKKKKKTEGSDTARRAED